MDPTKITEAFSQEPGIAKALLSLLEEMQLCAGRQRQMEQSLRGVIESAPDAIVLVNPEGHILMVNAQTEKWFGYKREELIGRTVETLIPERFRHSHAGIRKSFFNHKLNRPMESGLELFALRKNGSEFPVDISLSPLETEEGHMILGSIRDLSQKKQTEEKFRDLLDSAPDAMVVVDNDGKMVLVNAQVEKLFGYRREELLGQPVEILMPEALRKRHVGHRRDFMARSSEPRPMGSGLELFARRKDGTEFAVEISLGPIKTAEGILVSAAIRNVTDRKLAEQRIVNLNRRLEVAAREAEAANRAKSVFLSTMSHEIRTPMNAILGYAQLLLRDPSLSEAAKENLAIIGHSGEHLLTLINDVLEVSQIEAGRIEQHLKPFNLSQLLQQLAATFRLRAQGKSIRFEMSMSGEPVDYIKGDEVKLRQILINLVGNSVKFTETGFVRLGVNLEPRNTVLWLTATVEDSGSGIGSEACADLFQPFHQTERRLTVTEGTGLGLYISRKYARLMGGDLTMTSQLGQGSRFVLSVPVEPSQAPVDQGRSIPRVRRLAPGTVPPRILVADDHLENRDWMIKLLNSVGFLAIGVSDGLEALRAWREQSPELILMDVHMPNMDGLEATRRIKAHPEGETLPIIVTSASALDEDRKKIAAAGADAFLMKPVLENILFEKIGGFLNVTYEYDEPAAVAPSADQTNVSPAILTALSAMQLHELQEAVSSGNKKRLNQIIANVQSSGAQVAAATLQRMADNYEYDSLLKLFEAVDNK